MYIELDEKGPLYVQLTRALRTAILEGRLQAGVRMISTREMADELQLSRSTVVIAYEQLRAEGLIRGKVGSGSYVNVIENYAAKRSKDACVEPQSEYARRMRDYMSSPALPTYTKMRYVMQHGEPLTNPALTSVWSRELSRAARYANIGHPDRQGLLELREAIAEYLSRRRGVYVDAKRVLVVNGTQQAFTLCARILLNEGDRVVLEEPHYFGAYRVLGAHGADIVPVRTDQEGIVCNELPATPPKIIFVTPSHHFPGGSTMSLSRRRDLLHYARKHDCWIVEDDYDSEFCYNLEPLPALWSIDDSDQIIYAGTFSKTLLSSLRLGYLVLPEALAMDFINAKWLDDMGSSVIEQAALAHFIRTGGFERHLKRATKMLKARRDALINGLRRHAADHVIIHGSHVGTYVVAWLPAFDNDQCHTLIDNASRHGLGLFPIESHFYKPPPYPGLLLGYASLSVTELEEATRLLGQCIHELHTSLLPFKSKKPGSRISNTRIRVPIPNTSTIQ